MISRVAESCFWLHRCTERVENTARLLRVNRTFILEADLAAIDRWHPLIIVSGEEHRFRDLFPPEAVDDEEAVQEYLTWDERNPVSIVSAMHGARENARRIREVISVEMWEAINSFWQWLRGGAGRRAYRSNRDHFYRHVRDWPHMLYGLSHSMLMHAEPFDFMRLGMLLERAIQTSRILDVKHHMVGPTKSETETALESASWLGLLHSCSASEAFLKHRREVPTGRDVAEFILFEDGFPRSVRHCIQRAHNFLKRIRAAHGTDTRRSSLAAVAKLRERMDTTSIDAVLERGLHTELTFLIDSLADVCTTIDADYFSTPIAAMLQSRG